MLPKQKQRISGQEYLSMGKEIQEKGIANANLDWINKAYPGTDRKSFADAKKDILKYKFEDGEAERILNC